MCFQLTFLDLKLDNILVTFENESVLEEFVQVEAESPILWKIRDRYSIY